MTELETQIVAPVESASRHCAHMKTIGILGGSSDQATADYYRVINKTVNQKLGGWNTGDILISSMNFALAEHFVRNGLWEEAGKYLAGRACNLERALAEILICVSNTLHRVADDFTRELSIPFVHIVDPTATAIRAAGLTRVALLGTKPVMSTNFLKKRYQEKFAVEIVVPEEDEQNTVDRIIFEELCRGVLTAQSKAIYLALIDKLQGRGAEGVILGCTEIPLLISQQDRPEVPFFNTLELHVGSLVRLALDGC